MLPVFHSLSSDSCYWSFFFKSVHLPLLSSSLPLLLHLNHRVLCGSLGNTWGPMCDVFISNWIARSSKSFPCKLELGRPAGDVVHTVNDKNSVKHWQALLQSHDGLICGHDKGAGLCLYFSLRQKTKWRGRRTAHRVSVVLLLLLSRLLLPLIVFFFPPRILHLHQ